jgi:hypothetical protein
MEFINTGLIDQVTSAFVLLSLAFKAHTIKKVLDDKLVSGVSIPNQCFYTVFGLWFIYVFYSLGQYMSCYLYGFVFIMDLTYLHLAIKYHDKTKSFF